MDMEVLRDPFWQSIGAITAILALLLYGYVERDKISKLITGVLNRLQNILGRLGNSFPAMTSGVSIILKALSLLILIIFVLFVPIYLYKELIENQSVRINSSTLVDINSMFYILVVMVWCLSIIAISDRFVIDNLRAQIDYLNRIPGIQELKTTYNRELFDSVIKQWGDFRVELEHRFDDSPFAIDLAMCSPLEVRDEMLMIGCPNRVIFQRMNPSPSGALNDQEYDKKMRDKKSIEVLVEAHFQVKGLRYILKKIAT